MKIAIVHDLLVKLWWAEKVIEKLLNIYPNADLFTLIYDEKKVSSIFPKNKMKKIASITQNIYELTKNQRFCLPYMSRWVESLDLSEYDVVIASNSAFVHGCITKPETKFIVYYHTPARYMWDRTNEYKKEIWWNKWIKLFILNWMLKWLRQWDYLASKRHDITLANSKNVAKRLKKYYWLDSTIIYPNVDTNRFNKEINLENLSKETLDLVSSWEYYIIISALTEFKRIDLSINAFNKMKDKKLIIVWAWNFKENLEKMVEWNNILFTWPKYDDELVYLLQNSNWLIFCWEEDFWIVPIESFWAWVPVFAYKWWWLEETMIQWVTWEFFENKNWEDFIKNFEVFEKNIKSWKYDRSKIIEHSKNYDEEIFEQKIREIVWE